MPIGPLKHTRISTRTLERALVTSPIILHVKTASSSFKQKLPKPALGLLMTVLKTLWSITLIAAE